MNERCAMLKRERGAARTAGRNANVDDMEEWRRTRGSRASSARHPREEFRDFRAQRADGAASREEQWEPEWDPGSPPFWERDDPFGARRRDRQPRERPHWDAGQLREEVRQKQRDDRQFAEEFREQTRQDEQQSGRREFRRQPRQVDLREFRDARSHSRSETRQDDRQNGRLPQEDEERARRGGSRQNHARSHGKNRHNVLLLVMAMLGLAAIAVIIGLKVFEIRKIEVKGNDSVSAQNIIALSGIGVGENILKVDLGLAKKNIESDPLLEVLSISRVYPDGITIEIRQRKPHGAIAYLGGYVIIDEKGFVLDVRDSLPAGQYPLITGVEIQPSEKGKKLMGVDGVQQKTMYDLLTALYDNNAMQYVSEANLGNGGDIRLLTSEGLQISLGKPADLGKKAQWIACTIPELRNRGYTAGVLYITGTGSPVYSETGESAQQGETAGAGANGNDESNAGAGDDNADGAEADPAGGGDAA